MKPSKIRRKLKRAAERKAESERVKRLYEIESAKIRLDAEIKNTKIRLDAEIKSKGNQFYYYGRNQKR